MDMGQKADLSGDPEHAERLKAVAVEPRKVYADVNKK
jgi:hypothetical protein